MIHYGKQLIDEDDIEAVVRILRSSYLTQGPAVESFEEGLCKATGAKFAVAVNSGSAALYVTYAALGVGQGHRVWVPAITFAATANAAVMLGATVKFIDVDPLTGNVSLPGLEAMLALAQKTGELPDVVVAVHMAGYACDMLALEQLSKIYGFRIIEDAAHALGAQHGYFQIGGCNQSEAACFSFHPVKSITTGEGGAILTNNAGLAIKARILRHHGIVRDVAMLYDSNLPAYHYEQQDLGFNFRLSDIHAALGLSQLAKLSRFIKSRQRIARAYYQRLIDEPSIRLPVESDESAWHLYIVHFSEASTRDKAYADLKNQGVLSAVHYLPVYRHPYYQETYPGVCLPGAERFYDGALSLPIYPDLSDYELDRICQCILATVAAQTDCMSEDAQTRGSLLP